DKKAAELKQQGFELERLNAFVLPQGQGERYNAIWTKSATGRVSVWGWARADFDKRAAELLKQGFRFVELNAFVLPQGERYNAIWEKGSESPAVWGWTIGDLNKLSVKMRAQGFQLLEVNAFVP